MGTFQEEKKRKETDDTFALQWSEEDDAIDGLATDTEAAVDGSTPRLKDEAVYRLVEDLAELEERLHAREMELIDERRKRQHLATELGAVRQVPLPFAHFSLAFRFDVAVESAAGPFLDPHSTQRSSS